MLIFLLSYFKDKIMFILKEPFKNQSLKAQRGGVMENASLPIRISVVIIKN